MYQTVRLALSILKAYQAHLPLSGERLYPNGLGRVLPNLRHLCSLSEELGYKVGQFREDVENLRVLYESDKPKDSLSKVSPTAKNPQQPLVTKKKMIGMIDNLARESFAKARVKKQEKPNGQLREGAVKIPERLENGRHASFVESNSSNRFSDSKEMDDHPAPPPRVFVQHAPQIRDRGHRLRLELHEEEVDHIFRHRPEPVDLLPCSLSLVDSVVDEICQKVFMDVCDELTSIALFSNLVQYELTE